MTDNSDYSDPGSDIPSPFSHIEHPKKRLFLECFAKSGSVTKAAAEAGIHFTTPYGREWDTDPEFQAGWMLAREIAATVLEDVARHRALEGLKRFKFDKDGAALRHPENCECGHQAVQHVKGTGPCPVADCGCEAFRGAPYYELDPSDRLLEMLLKANVPHRYADRILLAAMLREIDVEKLPPRAMARIVGGEPVLQVLASLADETGVLPPAAVKLLKRGS